MAALSRLLFKRLLQLRKSGLWEGKACWSSTSAGGGKEVSRELEGENQALRDEISGQRVSRPKRRQTSRRWTVTKPDACSTPASWEDATRLPAPPRWECGVNDSSKDPDLQRLFEKELLGQLHEENMRLARATKKQKEKHRDRRGRLQRLQRHLRERSPMSLEYEF